MTLSRLRVCKVFGIVDVNSSEKPVTYCRAGSLFPAIPCPVRQRAGTESRPYKVGEKLVLKPLHTRFMDIICF